MCPASTGTQRYIIRTESRSFLCFLKCQDSSVQDTCAGCSSSLCFFFKWKSEREVSLARQWSGSFWVQENFEFERLVQKSLLCIPKLFISQKSKWMPEFHRFHVSRWTFIFEHISSQMVYSSCICCRFPATTTKYWRHIFVMRRALPIPYFLLLFLAARSPIPQGRRGRPWNPTMSYTHLI